MNIILLPNDDKNLRLMYNDKEFILEYKNSSDIKSLIKNLMKDIDSLEDVNKELIHCIAELQIENEVYKNTEILFD